MVKRFLKMAYRHIMADRVTALISIIGMATGIAGFILLTLFINYYAGFDRFHRNVDSIFRVEQATGSGYLNETPSFLSSELVTKVSGIKNATRIIPVSSGLSAGDGNIFPENGFLTDNSFLDIFSYPMLIGNIENCLNAPNSIVLSESLALKMFGTSESVGRSVLTTEKKVYEVTGVLEDPPESSVLSYSYLLGITPANNSDYHPFSGSWESGEVQTWILLDNPSSSQLIEDRIDNLVRTYREYPDGRDLFLKPLKEISLRPSGDNKKIVIVYSVGVIAFLILLVGTVNFMQLLINMFINRIRENSVRKVLGGTGLSLTWQFLGEGFILSLVALLVAFILSSLLLPLFNRLFYVNLEINLLNDPGYYSIISAFVLLTGTIAAVYPAVIVLRMGSVHMLKWLPGQRFRRTRLRNFLVTVQLTFSVFLVVCTFSLYQQVKFVQGMDKGFTTRDVMMTVINAPSTDPATYYALNQLKEGLKSTPGVISASLSTGAPFVAIGFEELGYEGDEADKLVRVATLSGDRDFINTYGIELISGQDLSADDLPLGACLVNEAACKQFGWTEPVGKGLKNNSLMIRGVVKDFNYSDLNWSIRPMIITNMPDSVNKSYVLSVRLVPEKKNPVSREELVRKINSISESLAPGIRMEYQFIDDLIPYDVVRGLSDGFLLFSVLAIFIASIGLFGLISYNVERERREIGIRKAFGCSSYRIFIKVVGRYLKLFIVSSAGGSIMAYLMLGRVMTIFAYRQPLGPLPFILTILLLTVVLGVSISWSALRASNINPAASVRYE